ncbi:hypothetical protein CsSME_00002659 [Camellia sinensis var. sinensis]
MVPTLGEKKGLCAQDCLVETLLPSWLGGRRLFHADLAGGLLAVCRLHIKQFGPISMPIA